MHGYYPLGVTKDRMVIFPCCVWRRRGTDNPTFYEKLSTPSFTSVRFIVFTESQRSVQTSKYPRTRLQLSRWRARFAQTLLFASHAQTTAQTNMEEWNVVPNHGIWFAYAGVHGPASKTHDETGTISSKYNLAVIYALLYFRAERSTSNALLPPSVPKSVMISLE